MVHTYHMTLIYLMEKKYASSSFIRWVLILQEFNFEVKDWKYCGNQVTDNLLRLQKKVSSNHETRIDYSFPEEQVFTLSFSHTPWYDDFENYIVCWLMPDELNPYQ